MAMSEKLVKSEGKTTRDDARATGDDAESSMDKAAQAAAEIGIEQCVGHIAQSVKKSLFA